MSRRRWNNPPRRDIAKQKTHDRDAVRVHETKILEILQSGQLVSEMDFVEINQQLTALAS